MKTLLALPLALLLSTPAVHAGEDVPAIFAKLDFETALAKSKAEGRTLILDAMTSWCAPCKQMDRTTWIDPRLIGWVADKGLAIQLDMDVEVALKDSLGITAFPTIVVFKDGAEYDRIVGFRTADGMLAWLGATLEGKRAEDMLVERLAALRAEDRTAANWQQRSHLVQDLLFAGMKDDSLIELLWLYDARPVLEEHAQGQFWSRHFFDMQSLAGDDDGRDTFAVMLDKLTVSVEAGTASESELHDWIRFGFVGGDPSASFAWAYEQTKTPEGLRALGRFEGLLFEPLVAAGHWRTAGLMLNEPLRHVTFLRDTLGAYDQPVEAGAGGMIPAIPMGGPKPKNATPDAKQPKVMPAIPMGGPKPKAATPKAATPKAMPMIPMMGGGMTKAQPVDAASAAAAQSAEIRLRLTEQFRREAAVRYAALLAAGREAEAAEVAAILIGEVDDARARTALVAAAMRAGAEGMARARHQAWLEEASE